MNRLLITLSLVSMGICLAVIYFSVEGLMPTWTTCIPPFLVAMIYAVSVDNFWKKISNTKTTDDEIVKLVKMLVRHKKDERTVNIITWNILRSDNLNHILFSSGLQDSILETLLATEKLRNGMFSVIKSLNDATRDRRVEEFRREFKGLRPIKEEKDHGLIGGVNHLIHRLFSLCGGYPTWTQASTIVQEYLKNQDKGLVDEFLISLEEGFSRTNKTNVSRHQGVDEGYNQLMVSVRKWVLEQRRITA